MSLILFSIILYHVPSILSRSLLLLLNSFSLIISLNHPVNHPFPLPPSLPPPCPRWLWGQGMRSGKEWSTLTRITCKVHWAQLVWKSTRRGLSNWNYGSINSSLLILHSVLFYFWCLYFYPFTPLPSDTSNVYFGTCMCCFLPLFTFSYSCCMCMSHFYHPLIIHIIDTLLLTWVLVRTDCNIHNIMHNIWTVLYIYIHVCQQHVRI